MVIKVGGQDNFMKWERSGQLGNEWGEMLPWESIVWLAGNLDGLLSCFVQELLVVSMHYCVNCRLCDECAISVR